MTTAFYLLSAGCAGLLIGWLLFVERKGPP